MSFKDKAIHVIIIVFVELLALWVFWFSLRQGSVSIPVPGFLKSIVQQDEIPAIPAGLPATSITPYPNEESVSTLPTITARFGEALSNNTKITIDPKVAVDTTYTEARTKVILRSQRPLQTETTYTVTIEDKAKDRQYSWSFTTSGKAIDPRSVNGIERLKEQLPYADPNGRFYIYYAPQTDLYFISIHDDERSQSEQQAALDWLKGQGIINPDSLEITWIPSESF